MCRSGCFVWWGRFQPDHRTGGRGNTRPDPPSPRRLRPRTSTRALNEPPHAAAVARYLAVRHEVVELAANDLVQACDAVSERLAEPLGDSSPLPTWLVCRAARRLMTVALGGDGADELFAGYPNFVAILLIGITPLSSGTICSAERTAKEAKNR